MSEGLQRLLQWYRDQHKTPEELLEQEIVRNWIPASNTRVTRTTALIPVARPWLDERDADAARRAILSGWVTQGPEVAAFEREFAAAVGAPHACAVSSCTTALHLALLAVGVGPGDEVMTVSHSFIATANAVRYCGATPVFVDVDLGHLQHRSGARRTRRCPIARRRCSSCTSSACRATWRRSWRACPAAAACR